MKDFIAGIAVGLLFIVAIVLAFLGLRWVEIAAAVLLGVR